MTSQQKQQLIDALIAQYPKAEVTWQAEMEDIARSDIAVLEPVLDVLMAEARKDGELQAMLARAYAAQHNEQCPNCGSYTLAVPF